MIAATGEVSRIVPAITAGCEHHEGCFGQQWLLTNPVTKRLPDFMQTAGRENDIGLFCPRQLEAALFAISEQDAVVSYAKHRINKIQNFLIGVNNQ